MSSKGIRVSALGADYWLLPCPFCGSVDLRVAYVREWARVECSGVLCHCVGPEVDSYYIDGIGPDVASNVAAAVERWNRRPGA